MEIKVRDLTEVEAKSKQQIEQELLDKHEKEQVDPSSLEESNGQAKVEEPVAEEVKEEKQLEAQEETKVEEPVAEEVKEEKVNPIPIEEKPSSLDLDDQTVLSYIENRYGKEINSIDELVSKREESEPLPEDVAAYLKYKKETGRGIDDYAKLQADYSDYSPDSLLREYYTITEEGLDPEDIDSIMEEFTYDTEHDDVSEVKKLKIAKKKEIAKAKKFFKQQQELYKQPLESRESSAQVKEELEEYKQYRDNAKNDEQVNAQKQKWFSQKTEEVLNDNFKGFKFDVGNEQLIYSPDNYTDIKKDHSTPLNFVNKFIDEKGFLKDAENYHRGLSMAMNPEKFARFFYEQGKSQATEDVMKKTKNIDMNTRSASEAKPISNAGLRVKSVSQPSGKGLKIRSINKV